jgi:hypothetical protein
MTLTSASSSSASFSSSSGAVFLRTSTLALGLLLAASSSAMAAEPNAKDPAAADALFRDGRKAMQAGNYAVACPKFQESYRLDPAPGTLLNLGDCEEKQGHLAAAWQYFRDAEQRLGSDERAGIAKQRWEALDARLAFVTFKLPANAPPDTKVVRDDVELRAAALTVALPIDPGPHVVRVRAPGHVETKIDLSLKSGERKEVPLEIGAAAPSSAASDNNNKGGSSFSTSDPNQRPNYLPWIAYSVAAAGLITMGIGAWQVLDAKSVVEEKCDPNKLCEQAGLDAADKGKAFSIVGTVGGAVFLLGAAAGTYLLLTSPKKSTTGMTVRPAGATTIGGFALGATGTF